MWFGDLVTMKWWDDLWLKESFADYMGTLGVDRTTDWDTAWVNFANNRKAWAYVQDQLPTTHPIVADIRDLEAAKQNFDGITYAKGASVLKQLVAYVGFEAFIAGSRQYFRDHAYGNTTLAELLAALSAASGRDLSEWARQWLQTSGISTLSSEITGIHEDSSALSSVAVLQDAVDPATGRQEPRPHRLRIGLYDFDDAGALVRTDSVETDVRGARTDVTALVGKPRPALLLVNDEDLSYAKVRLDPHSEATVRGSLDKLEDPMARALCWTALWDSARDAVTPAALYVDAVGRFGPAEPGIGVLLNVLGNASTAVERYVPRGQRDAVRHGFLTTAAEQLQAAAPGSDQQLAWARTLAATSRVRRRPAGPAPGHPGRQHGDRRPRGGRRTALESLACPGGQRPGLAGAARPGARPGQHGGRQVRARHGPRRAPRGIRQGGRLGGRRPRHRPVQPAPRRHDCRVQHRRGLPAGRVHRPVLRIPRGRLGGPEHRDRQPDCPRLLPRGTGPGRPATPETHAVIVRTDQWLAAHPDAPRALRRIIIEQRSQLHRSLRAQALTAQHRRLTP